MVYLKKKKNLIGYSFWLLINKDLFSKKE